MTSKQQYDMIVIGGGTAGLVTAAGSAGIGARVALIERNKLGGECLWNGCVPSKAVIASARAVHQLRHAARFGATTGGVEVDFAGVMAWMRGVQAQIAPNDSPDRFREMGVDVIQGEAHFTGLRTITVNDQTLTAKRITVATGSSPAIPPIDGLSSVPYLTNETVFALDRLPTVLIILGGGPIGLEMAQAFARLGSVVHVIEAGSAILAHDDAELTEMLTPCILADGVELHLGTKAIGVTQTADGIAVETTSGEGKSLTIQGDTLLVATGRKPNLASLKLDAGGIRSGKQGIEVDAALQTSARGVWAAGDCVGPLRFTHVAEYQARLVVRNAFFPFSAKANYSTVPWVTYTDPELAHVGLTEQEARGRFGSAVRVWRRPFRDVDRANTDGHTDGMVKLVTNAHGKILGGHILGYGAGNMIGEITVAMKYGLSASKLADVIHPYPTYPDAIRQAANEFQKSRFTGLVKTAAGWFARR